MKTLDKQKKNVLTLCGAAMASLLLWGCGGTNPTTESFERSDYYTRGIGQYPGDPKEDFSPSLAPDPSTYRNIARLRSAFASSSHDYNLVAQLATDGIVTDKQPQYLNLSTPDGDVPRREREWMIDEGPYSRNTFPGGDTYFQFTLANYSKAAGKLSLVGTVVYDDKVSKGGYEIISGHRRQYAAKLAGLDTLPVIVRQMSDDAAVILMVDSNLQREHILPSERALAYKMKLEAIKNQGARSDLTSPQVAAKFRSDDAVAKDQGISGDTVRRYIRLTNLIPELLDMVDEKKISFNPAVELSYLNESQQRDFLEAMDGTQNAPSVSQAQQLKKMAQCGEFTYEKAFDILGQEKKSEQDTVTIKNDILRKYFPRSYTPRQMEEKIIQLLDAWQRKQQRHNER